MPVGLFQSMWSSKSSVQNILKKLIQAVFYERFETIGLIKCKCTDNLFWNIKLKILPLSERNLIRLEANEIN